MAVLHSLLGGIYKHTGESFGSNPFQPSDSDKAANDDLLLARCESTVIKDGELVPDWQPLELMLAGMTSFLCVREHPSEVASSSPADLVLP